jgi:hypothetical protein
MKKLSAAFIFYTTMCLISFGQKSDAPTDKMKSEQEIRKLLKDLNEAMQKHDRGSLENIFAEEFLFIHGFGFIDNKTEHINAVMETDSIRMVPIPPFDQFFESGNMAVLRALIRNPIGGNNLMSTSTYIKRGGRWQILQVQSTQQQHEKKSVTVDSKILELYVGKYTGGNKMNTMITLEGDVLSAQRMGWPKQSLIATSENQFFNKHGSSLTFYRNEDGKVSHFVFRAPNGQEVKWNKAE